MSVVPGQTDTLFKKFLGTPNSVGSLSYAAEAAGSARPFIPASQVMNEEIPLTAPSDLSLVTILSKYTTGKGTATKQVSITYPHIAKYTLQLKDAQQANLSFRYNNPASGGENLNLLSNAIPFNYDAIGGTYAYSMTCDNSNNLPSSYNRVIPASDATYGWVLDPDAGYVYFMNNNTTGLPTDQFGHPVITFWRYEGTFGVGGGSGELSLSSFNINNTYPENINFDAQGFSIATPNTSPSTLKLLTTDLSVNGNLMIGKNLVVNNTTISGNTTLIGNTTFSGNTIFSGQNLNLTTGTTSIFLTQFI
jgi:hypothetical protein